MLNGSAAGHGNFVNEMCGFLTPSTARRALTRVLVYSVRMLRVESTMKFLKGPLALGFWENRLWLIE